MRIISRYSAPRPSTANAYMSSALWHVVNKDDDGDVASEIITVDRSPTAQATVFVWPHGDRVTALEMEDVLANSYELDVGELFDILRAMPHLQDLSIDNDPGQLVGAPSAEQIAALPFSLRRLVLGEAFTGWIHLLRNSRGTLECLSLGTRPWDDPALSINNGRPDYAPRYAVTCEGVSLSEFPKLRALRMEDTPEPRLLSACARLTSLTVTGDARYLSVVQLSLRGPLTRLTIIYFEFTNEDAVALSKALDFAVFRMLRALTVEVFHPDDELELKGHPGRMALADACRGRRIAISVVRVRPYCEWEKLGIASRRGT